MVENIVLPQVRLLIFLIYDQIWLIFSILLVMKDDLWFLILFFWLGKFFHQIFYAVIWIRKIFLWYQNCYIILPNWKIFFDAKFLIPLFWLFMSQWFHIWGCLLHSLWKLPVCLFQLHHMFHDKCTASGMTWSELDEKPLSPGQNIDKCVRIAKCEKWNTNDNLR